VKDEKSLQRQAQELHVPDMVDWAEQSEEHRHLVLEEIERRAAKARAKVAHVLLALATQDHPDA
jgi:hypothetical protein